MKLYDKNKILKELTIPKSFNKNNGIAWRIIEQNGFKILFGIMIDSTSDKNCFRLYWFYQCLYVPRSTYNMGCGDDIGIFSISETELADEKLQQVLQKHTIHTFEDFIKKYGKDIPCYNQGIANRSFPLVATLIVLGKYRKALFVLNRIKRLYLFQRIFHRKDIFISTDMIQLFELREILKRGQYDSALSLLKKWQDFTIQALRI